jgi:ABC-type lipoprotein export system ATPase subunit
MQTGYTDSSSGIDSPPILRAENVRKTYRRNGISTEVLKGVDFAVHAGEFVSIVGASGSGKSTLLHLMGTLDSPDNGGIWLGDKRIDSLPGRDRDRLRNGTFGFIFPNSLPLKMSLLPSLWQAPCGNGRSARKLPPSEPRRFSNAWV